jgi:hypothetical protein
MRSDRLGRAMNDALARLNEAQKSGKLTDDMVYSEVEFVARIARKTPKPPKPATALNDAAARRLAALNRR